jgi:hypothetical protein
MKNKFTKIILIAGLCTLAGGIYAGVSIMADQAMEPAPDPKKKQAGAQCKSSDECQRHHACSKVGEKSVCVAPVRPNIPNT